MISFRRVGMLLIRVLVAVGLVTPGLAALNVQSAGAHADNCGVNCVLVPTPAQDATYGVDNTGSVESSLQMMKFLAHVSTDKVHTATNRLTVQLQPGSRYWFAYSIYFKYTVNSNGGMWDTHVAPTLPSFDLSHVTLDLNSSTIDQCAPAAASYLADDLCYGTFNQSRYNGGNPILTNAGATDITIDGKVGATSLGQLGHLTNSAFKVDSADPPDEYASDLARWQQVESSLAYENWHAIKFQAGANGSVESDLNAYHLAMEWLGGDGVYMIAPSSNYAANPATSSDIANVNVISNFILHTARHGVTVMGGTTISVSFNYFWDIGHLVVDSEASKSQGWQDLTIAYNNGSSGVGTVAYIQLQAPSRGSGLRIIGNAVTQGKPKILVDGSGAATPRSGIQIDANDFATNNATCPVTGSGTAPINLITVRNYTGTTVSVTNNKLKMTNTAYAVSAPGAAITGNTLTSCT